MTDQISTTEPPTTTAPVQGNEPAARTTDGTLLNQTTEPPASTTEPPAGAPDAYADFTAPEGVPIDKEAIAASAPLFKELNLTQEQAQKLVTLQAQRESDLIKRATDTYNDTRREWRETATREMGGEARMRSEVIPTVGRALDTLSPETRTAFTQAMDQTGAGDNPAFVKVFYEFAKKITEARPVTGDPPTTKPVRPGVAQSMYPNLS